MQQFMSRGKIYNLPDTATHAAPGVVSGLYYKADGKWNFIGSDGKDYGRVYSPGWFDEDVVILKRNPFSFWNKIKGAIFK